MQIARWACCTANRVHEAREAFRQRGWARIRERECGGTIEDIGLAGDAYVECSAPFARPLVDGEVVAFSATSSIDA